MNAQEWIDKHGSPEAALEAALERIRLLQEQMKLVQRFGQVLAEAMPPLWGREDAPR